MDRGQPKDIQIGRITGVSMRIKQAISIRHPKSSISTLSIIRIKILLSVMENSTPDTCSGTFK